jgi:hypothetical protein
MHLQFWDAANIESGEGWHVMRDVSTQILREKTIGIIRVSY